MGTLTVTASEKQKTMKEGVFMARHGENIRKRKDGRWEARVICGYQPNGKARYKSFYGRTYDEVRKRKNELTAGSISCRVTVKLQKETVETLLEEWLSSIQCRIKESTMAKYQFYAYRHIIPELGEILLINLTNEDIEKFKIHKLTDGRFDKKGGLSPKTVVDMLSVLKLALLYGEERKYFADGQIKIRNPRQFKPQINILTPDEQQRLEKGLLYQQDCTHLGIIIALYTGLRIGEICALRWEDIDFARATLTVCRTIMRISDYSSTESGKTKIIIGPPKTECSSRLIPIPESLMNYLRRYRKDSSYYVVTGKESFIEPRNYYRKYKRIMKTYNLDSFTFHALRHTFATRCVEQGFDIKSLSEILGHADVSVTMQRYAHPSMNLKRYYMEKLEMVTFHGQKNGQEKESSVN